ncbi:MAG: c-type cytochrome [Thiobacillus sp.]|nr:c-type cytochrome [Thiobacillus sp.]
MSHPFKTWLRSQKETKRFHPSWIVIVVVGTAILWGTMWYVAKFAGKEIAESTGHPVDTTKQPGSSTHGTGQRTPEAEAPKVAVQQPSSDGKSSEKTNVQHASFTPPPPDAIPEGPFGDAVRLGRNIFNDTQTYARAYVGNGLNCVNCHLDEGRKANSAPLWAAYGMFPAYRDKNHKVNTYEDRLSGCFRFSMNGTAPPPGSKELVALMSYSFWLAKGAPTGEELPGRGYPKLSDPLEEPDVKRGQKLFETNCAICHGSDGQGTQVKGRYVFPPLWGKNSFNGGAGMSKDHNAAGFIKANMPLGQGGLLTDQEAWDVAKYMNSHSRPPDPRKAGK